MSLSDEQKTRLSAPATQPLLTVYSGATILGSNGGWSTAANSDQIAAAATATGAFVLPNGSADAAMLLTLQPGSYTAQVAANGPVLLEAYGVP